MGLLSTRLFRSVELLLSRTVMSRDLRSVELNTSPSAGPSKRFMMLRMMLLSAELKLRRNVRMRHLATPPTPSAPSGPRRCAAFPRSKSRSTPPSPDVPRSQESCVPQLVVDSSRELRSVMTRPRQLFRMPPRNSVLLSPRELASMSPRRSVPDPEPTQERSRSQLSRNGVTFLLRNLVWLKSSTLIILFKTFMLIRLSLPD